MHTMRGSRAGNAATSSRSQSLMLKLRTKVVSLVSLGLDHSLVISRYPKAVNDVNGSIRSSVIHLAVSCSLILGATRFQHPRFLSKISSRRIPDSAAVSAGDWLEQHLLGFLCMAFFWLEVYYKRATPPAADPSMMESSLDGGHWWVAIWKTHEAGLLQPRQMFRNRTKHPSINAYNPWSTARRGSRDPFAGPKHHGPGGRIGPAGQQPTVPNVAEHLETSFPKPAHEVRPGAGRGTPSQGPNHGPGGRIGPAGQQPTVPNVTFWTP